MNKLFSPFLILLVFTASLTVFSLPAFADKGKNFNLKQTGDATVVDEINFSQKVQKSQQTKKEKDYIEGEVLVKYKKNKINLNTSFGRKKALHLNYSKSLESKTELKTTNVALLKVKDGKTVEEKIAELQNDPNIEYAEPNYKRYPATINTNDTYKGNLWGLDNTGQNVNGVSGTNDADMDIPEAWVISETATSSPVIVAIIDSGVDYNHPDLIANMWDGTNCKDKEGSIIIGGCNHGYDYEDGDITPLPTGGYHGTHIAGTIAATGDNNKGIIGVAPDAKIMALKFGLDIATEVQAIDFAIQNGAKVINASFTGASFSQSEYDAINRFKTAGGIFVAAAGNDGANNDAGTHLYPADYTLDNIISVTATDQNDNLAYFSNYGVTSVDIGAPGVNIYSTIGAGEQYVHWNGTSMASPHVAGLVALLEGYNSDLIFSQVKNIILSTGDEKASLSGKTVSGKRANAYKALQGAGTAKDITSFSFPEGSGVITGTNIAVSVPYGTNVTALVPTIVITGASVS
ncbi:S8 family serine peptidase, partial [Patescibacteria group bacterium]|nr:S8 family serine peptidase [Patescibacteria group bacterium]